MFSGDPSRWTTDEWDWIAAHLPHDDIRGFTRIDGRTVLEGLVCCCGARFLTRETMREEKR